MYTIDELETKIRPLKRLKLSNFTPIEETLESFILNFFKRYNKDYDSERIANGVVERTAGQMRSIEDVFSICRTYYPKTTLKQVLQCMFTLASQQKIHGKWKCKQIQKYVFSGSKTSYDDSSIRQDIFSDAYPVKIRTLYEELGFDTESFER